MLLDEGVIIETGHGKSRRLLLASDARPDAEKKLGCEAETDQKGTESPNVTPEQENETPTPSQCRPNAVRDGDGLVEGMPSQYPPSLREGY